MTATIKIIGADLAGCKAGSQQLRQASDAKMSTFSVDVSPRLSGSCAVEHAIAGREMSKKSKVLP
jgi:hypothetical protein